MKTIIAIFLLLASNSLFPDGNGPLKKYEGEMRCDVYPFDEAYTKGWGEGYYTYYESDDGSRIKHGDYFFKYFDFKYAFFSDEDEWNTSISGKFVNGKKHGLWTVRRIEKKGSSIEVSLSYSNDILDGKCWHKISELTFNMGKYVAVKSNDVKGQFDDDGYVDGEWIITDAPFDFHWIFEHGEFNDSYIYDNSTGNTTRTYIDPKRYIGRLLLWDLISDNEEAYETVLKESKPGLFFSNERSSSESDFDYPYRNPLLNLSKKTQKEKDSIKVLLEGLKRDSVKVLIEEIKAHPVRFIGDNSSFVDWLNKSIVQKDKVKTTSMYYKHREVYIRVTINSDGSVNKLEPINFYDNPPKDRKSKQAFSDLIKYIESSKWERGSCGLIIDLIVSNNSSDGFFLIKESNREYIIPPLPN